MNTPTSSNTDLVLNSHSRKKAAFMTKFPVRLQGNFKSTLTLSTYNTQLTSPQYTQLNFREVMKKIAEIACSWTISTTKPFPFFNNGNVISIMWPLPILQIQEGTTPVDLLLPNKKSRTRESQEGEGKKKKNLQQRMVKPRQKCRKYSHKRQFNTSLTQQQHCKTMRVELTKCSPCLAPKSHNITLKILLSWLPQSGNTLNQRYIFYNIDQLPGS